MCCSLALGLATLACINACDVQPIPRDITTLDKVKAISEEDRNFVCSMPLAVMFDTLEAAEFLQIDPLMDLILARVALAVRGKDIKELLSHGFQVFNMFTEEEMTHEYLSHPWAAKED